MTERPASRWECIDQLGSLQAGSDHELKLILLRHSVSGQRRVELRTHWPGRDGTGRSAFLRVDVASLPQLISLLREVIGE
jgi:hypothetical protein